MEISTRGDANKKVNCRCTKKIAINFLELIIYKSVKSYIAVI